jgi:O-antigen biosynthesis protein WbqP
MLGFWKGCGAKLSGSARRDDSELRPFWKRSTDIVGGLAAFAVAAAPMFVIAAAIVAESGRPVLLRQRRIGIHGQEFRMWKFRTLPVDTPQLAKSELRASGLRPSRLGRFLRRYSLDELPQLLNVLGGDMSLVGPRPALFTQHDLVALRRDAGVLRVRPGLTGFAQIRGRESLSLEEKVALDAEYVRRMSPLTDLSIVLRTASAVLRARGSY